MDVEPDTLKRYEDALREAEERAANLRLIVEGMRGLTGSTTREHTVIATSIPSEEAFGAATVSVSKMTYGGRPSIPAVILDVLDENESDLDTIYQRICAHSAYEDGKRPSRGSVNNRLNDMATRGEIVKVRRGVYKSLPPTGGAENPDESGEGPNLAQLDEEKPPGEQSMPAHRGQPDGEGSTKVVSRL